MPMMPRPIQQKQQLSSSGGGGVPLFQPGPIDDWFLMHSGFVYHPSADVNIVKEFKRLAKERGWGEKQRMKAKYDFHLAIDAEFTQRVGKGVELFDWQRLVRVIGIEKIPPSITKCKKVLAKENIYIYDILHHYRRAPHVDRLELIEPSGDVKRFKTVPELRKYCTKRMFYPRDFAKGCVLKGLLKQLL